MIKILVLVSELNNEFKKNLARYIGDTLCYEKFELFYKEAVDEPKGEFDVCIIDRTNLANCVVRSYVSKKTILYFKKHFVDFYDIQKLIILNL